MVCDPFARWRCDRKRFKRRRRGSYCGGAGLEEALCQVLLRRRSLAQKGNEASRGSFESRDGWTTEVEQLARTRGFEIAAVFEEGASAVKKRPEYERMMKEAKKGVFDVVIVWALDRHASLNTTASTATSRSGR